MGEKNVSEEAATATTPAAVLTKVAQRLRQLIVGQARCDL